jgi:hypothetical protein
VTLAERITANKAPRILDVEGFFFSYLSYPEIPEGWLYGHSICTKGIKRTLRPD